jgi:hypothetical protein
MTYFEDNAVSNSALSTFSYDPSYYYKLYVTKEIEKKDDTDATLLGSLVHCLLLEPETFDTQYVVSTIKPEEMPSGMMLDFIKALSKHQIIDDVAYQDAYNKSGYKISYDKVLENYNKSKANTAYLEQLQSPKKYISQTLYDKARELANIVENSTFIDNALGTYPDWKELKELELFWKSTYHIETIDGVPRVKELQRKGKLDHVFYRIEGNTLYIKYIDYKTDSQKPVHKYDETFAYWKTHRQLAYYYEGLTAWRDENYPDFAMVFEAYIMVIDVVRSKCLLYKISHELINEGIYQINKDLKDLCWHIHTDRWEYPKHVYENINMIPILKPSKNENLEHARID